MNDYGKSVLEQYDMEFTNLRRGRGCLFADDAEGTTYRLVEYNGSKVHLELEQEIETYLAEEGSIGAEVCVPNRAGTLYCVNRENCGYVLRRFIDGTECSASNQKELCAAMEALARFHLLMRQFHGNPVLQQECFVSPSLEEEYERKLRELRRVAAYLKRKKKKNSYEHCICDTLAGAIAQGEQAAGELKRTAYTKLYEQSCMEGRLCHGRYHYHHIRFGEAAPVITGLEHACVQVQLVDIYQFLRKVLEKCGWSVQTGQLLLEQYQQILPLSREERQVLGLLFCFPEKYYKQVNFYYNTRKTWISPKSLEKLEKAVRQQEQRLAFAQTLL